MGIQRQDDSALLREIEEMWAAAKGQLADLRRGVEEAARMGAASQRFQEARGSRDVALFKLGEAFYRLVESGQASVPAALKRAVAEVKVREFELARQQADIAAILKEADSLADRAAKRPAPKKKAGR